LAKQTKKATGGRRNARGGTAKLLLGIGLGIVMTLLGTAAWLRFGNPPVAVRDAESLWEPLVETVPANARARSESKTPPFPASEDAFEAGAKVYRAHCSQCHGSPGHDSMTGRNMRPQAPQFFTKADRAALAGQAPGELYWKTAYGIRRSGMPAYGRVLTDTQVWQLSLLLAGSGDDLPDPVKALLTEGLPPMQPTSVRP
jgi:mono/diheme cytochrome c family protein